MFLKRNLGATFVIKHLEFSDVSIFKEILWSPAPGINVMLGRNGYGKSYLLRLMVGLLSYDNDQLVGFMAKKPGKPNTKASKPEMKLALLKDNEPVQIEHDGIAFNAATGKVPVLAIPDARFINGARDSVEAGGGDYSDLARHGAHHFCNYPPPRDSYHPMMVWRIV